MNPFSRMHTKLASPGLNDPDTEALLDPCPDSASQRSQGQKRRSMSLGTAIRFAFPSPPKDTSGMISNLNSDFGFNLSEQADRRGRSKSSSLTRASIAKGKARCTGREGAGTTGDIEMQALTLRRRVDPVQEVPLFQWEKSDGTDKLVGSVFTDLDLGERPNATLVDTFLEGLVDLGVRLRSVWHGYDQSSAADGGEADTTTRSSRSFWPDQAVEYSKAWTRYSTDPAWRFISDVQPAEGGTGVSSEAIKFRYVEKADRGYLGLATVYDHTAVILEGVKLEAVSDLLFYSEMDLSERTEASCSVFRTARDRQTRASWDPCSGDENEFIEPKVPALTL